MSIKSQFADAKTFSIFYGYNEEKKLSQYDVVIIEPNGHSENGLARLKKAGCLVIGYLSVIEMMPEDPRKNYLKDEDYLKLGGNKAVNSIFGNYLMDIRSKKWQEVLFHECGRLIHALGYDGIFLDTIGNVEDHAILEAYGNALIDETVLFLKKLRNRFPETIIIQNNAIEKLIYFSSGIVDGICWENPPIGNRDSKLWMDEILNRLTKAKSEDGTQIMVALESDSRDDKRILNLFNQRGFLTNLLPVNYLELDE